jgi:hypothetical protein
MQRAKHLPLLVLLAGLALLCACGGKFTPADKSAFAILDVNQTACDPLIDGVAAAYKGATVAPAATGGSGASAAEDAVHAYLAGPGAVVVAEVQAGLPFAEKAIRRVAPEQSETRNLLVDWQERQGHLCTVAAEPPSADDLKNFMAERERVQKAIREDREKLAGTLSLSPAERSEITKDRKLSVDAAVKEKRGELAAQAQLAEQRAARIEAEAAEAHQLVLDDQAREEEKKRMKLQEEEDKTALVAERRAAEELEIKMKRERQEKTMRERQLQGAVEANRQIHSWAGIYRQQIEPFARAVRTAQRSAASDPSLCPTLRHAADGVRIPQAPDPNLQGHLSEALRLVAAAADSCGQKLRDTTAFRLQLVMEHLSAIERELPSGSS